MAPINYRLSGGEYEEDHEIIFLEKIKLSMRVLALKLLPLFYI